MGLNPEMRASDADRDRVAAALREHCAQGRLDIDELDGRLETTYAARTIGDLERVTLDLPEEDMGTKPVPARSTPAPRRRSLGPGWRLYAMVNLICFTIWLISSAGAGDLLFPWWVWVAGPWGAVILATRVFRH